MNITLDFETFSTIDLPRVGFYRYSIDPSTGVNCLAFKLGSSPTKVWVHPFHNAKLVENLATQEEFENLLTIIRGQGYDHIYMHNAEFDLSIWNNHFARYGSIPKIPLNKVSCTQALARYNGLFPSSLADVSERLDLSVKKWLVGHSIMKQFSKGDSCSTEHTPEDVATLCKYNTLDVESTALIPGSLPVKELPKREKEMFMLTYQMNSVGIGWDTQLANKIQKKCETIIKTANRAIKKLTNNEIETVYQAPSISLFLRKLDKRVTSTNQENITLYNSYEDKNPIVDKVFKLLSKSRSLSHKKAQTASSAVYRDSLHSSMSFYKNRTGRYSGQGVHLLNIPKSDANLLENIEKITKVKDIPTALSCLRGCIIPRNGYKLVGADFSRIELKLLANFAGQTDLVEKLDSGFDLYSELAKNIFNKDKIDKDSKERALGKQAILGLGYGQGASGFHKACLDKGLSIDLDLAKACYTAYHDAYPKIKQLKNKLYSSLKPLIHESIGSAFYFKLPAGRAILYNDVKYHKEFEIHLKRIDKKYIFNHVYTYLNKEKDIMLSPNLLVENLCQCSARDICFDKMLLLAKKGFRPVLNVHDEIVCETDKSEEELKAVMEAPVPWLNNKSFQAETWSGDRYLK